MEEERIEEIPEGADDIVSAVVVEPEEPWLSILHLMVWATCVAVYMSGRQTAMLGRTEVPIEGVTTVFFALLGMLGGTMLASLPLLVVRRVRGQMFPRSGGEILWILVGLGAVSGLMTQLIHGLLGGTIPAWTYQLVMITMALFVWLPAYVYAIVQSRGRWRIFFGVHPDLAYFVATCYRVGVSRHPR